MGQGLLCIRRLRKPLQEQEGGEEERHWDSEQIKEPADARLSSRVAPTW